MSSLPLPLPQLWRRRREAASQLRESVKEQLRLSHFVSVQPSECIMPISRKTLRGIYEKIADGLPRTTQFPAQARHTHIPIPIPMLIPR